MRNENGVHGALPATAALSTGKEAPLRSYQIAANEILVSNNAVANIVREGRVERLVDVIQSGKKEGMQLMDDELDRLVKGKIISGHEAFMNAYDKRRFEHLSEQKK